MPLGSKIKTTNKKKWREEKDYISRNQERVKEQARRTRELEGHAVFALDTIQPWLPPDMTLWHKSDGLDRVLTPLIILISQNKITS